ncbi:MAG: alpha-glucosidase, partial [Spirochaetales bacterium]|nr:alpha-glucosidase [Spirochaetales bacterium]
MIRLLAVEGGFDLFLGSRQVVRHRERQPFITLGEGRASYSMRHGNFRVRDRITEKYPCRKVEVDEAAGKVTFPGFLEMNVSEEDGRCVLAFRSLQERLDRCSLAFLVGEEEHFFGGGEQFSYLDLKGKKIPVWVQEQGVGRGFNVVRFAADLHSGAGGDFTTTYFPQPTFVSSGGLFLHAETEAWSLMDFSRRGTFTFSAHQVPGRIVLGSFPSLAEAVGSLSLYLGRQPDLPEWVYDGMWLGVQGGTEAVEQKLRDALDAGVKVSALWAQDWEGKRITSFGKQLMWNWEYSAEMYGDLPGEITGLRERGLRFLGYINPFLAVEGNLYREAREKGYCVKNESGEDYLVVVTTFPAAVLDLTNPEAFSWIKGIIKKNMIGLGLSGWMADFGEYLPTDGVLFSGEKGERVHNRYPALWAKANREALEESGKLGEIVFFTRAGYTGTSRYSTALWAGDQMANWLRDDGIPSVIPAGLSCGFCGIAYFHSDIGGYTSLGGVRRTKELFMRWAEMAAFTPIMRSHEGNRPDENWQFNGDKETLEHLAMMTRTYAGLKPYHLRNAAEYAERGLPPMRHPAIHYPEERELYG